MKDDTGAQALEVMIFKAELSGLLIIIEKRFYLFGWFPYKILYSAHVENMYRWALDFRKIKDFDFL